ncbi:hypothetical protein K501DRAFT_269705 [Backusella circina FSU 941]|nr:hypothetical protein K501DRAFT_269705 [Backusella circina FSU 941]
MISTHAFSFVHSKSKSAMQLLGKQVLKREDFVDKEKQEHFVSLKPSNVNDIPDLDPTIIIKPKKKTNFLLGLILDQFILRNLYTLGKGAEKDKFMPYDWHMKSAIRGFSKALARLHHLHHTKKGMSCCSKRDVNEKEWTQSKFKERNRIRELAVSKRKMRVPLYQRKIPSLVFQRNDYL